MRENLLKKQPTWGLRRAQGTGQKSATPATLTKVILVLLTMFLLPSAAWADYTYGSDEELFYYEDIHLFKSGSAPIWTVSMDGNSALWPAYIQDTNPAQYSPFAGFNELTLTRLDRLKGELMGFALEGKISSSANVKIIVYKLATKDATERTKIGTVTINEGTTSTYTYTAENGVSQVFNNEYIQLAFEHVEGDASSIEVDDIAKIILTFSGTSYGLKIDDVRVTSNNAEDILGDNKVSYSSNTLTLSDGASFQKIRYSGSDNLTIAFDGTVSISSSDTVTIVSTSDLPKLLFSSTNGSLNLSGNGVIGGFSDVDFGNLNLASISNPGIYWNKNKRKMQDINNSASNATITTEKYYPIWIYDPSLVTTGYSHTQLKKDEKLSVAVGSGTITFDQKHTITISSAQFNSNNTFIVVGPSMSELTVDLVGESTGDDATILNLWDTTPLTFTTEDSNSKLTTAASIISWEGDGNGQVTYQNGLVFNLESSPYRQTISTTGVRIKIGDISINATGDITGNGIEGTVRFETSTNTNTNTLTLTDATIGGATAGKDIQVFVDDLKVVISGNNTVYGDITYVGNNNQSSSIQINKAEGATASLTMTNIEQFGACTWGDGLYLSANNSVDVRYEFENGEGAFRSYYGEISTVTISTNLSYPLWINGIQATEGSVTGTGIAKNGESVSEWGITFIPATNTLKLQNVLLSTNKGQTPAIISGLDNLNIQIEGNNNVSITGSYGGYTALSTKSNAVLTITTEDDGQLNTTNGSSSYSANPFHGFQSVTFNGDLIYIGGSGCQYIRNLGDPGISLSSENKLKLSSSHDGYGSHYVSYYYTLDFADSDENDVVTPTLLGEEKPTISEACTVTAYISYEYKGNEYNDYEYGTLKKTGENNPAIGKYFKVADKTIVFNSTTSGPELKASDLELSPTTKNEGVSIQNIYDAYNSYVISNDNGQYTIAGIGSCNVEVNISVANDAVIQVLNRDGEVIRAIGEVTVVPDKPTITIEKNDPERNYYLNTDEITITRTSVVGEVAENIKIFYTWAETAPKIGSDYTHDTANPTLTIYDNTKPIPAQTGTLWTWVGYQLAVNEYLMSEVASQALTVKTDISDYTVQGLATSATYTGAAIVPAFSVKASADAETSLTLNSDYTVSYQSVEVVAGDEGSGPSINYTDVDEMVEVGAYRIVITGTGDSYGGTKYADFAIDKADLDIVTIEDIEDQTYTGSTITLEGVTVTLNGKTISPDEYEITGYTNNTNVTTETQKATVTITATATSEHFTENTTKTAEFNIIPKELTEEMVTVSTDPDPLIYNGEDQTPNVTVTIKDGETTLEEGEDKDYTISYKIDDQIAEETVDAGTYTIVITGQGNYTGEVNTKTFTIAAMDASAATITLEADKTYTYNGSDQTPAVVSVELDGGTIPDTNYDISYSNNKNAGLATAGENAPTVIVTFKNNYSGEATTTFTIEQADLSDYAVTGLAESTAYTGSPIIPEFSVKATADAETSLTANTDYSVKYQQAGADVDEMKDAGDYKILITGEGNYKGSLDADFTIERAELELTINLEGWAYGDTPNEPSLEGNLGEGDITWEYKAAGAEAYSAWSALTATTDAGTYMVRATVAETDNYAGGSKEAEFVIAQYDLANATVTLDPEELVYNGEVQTVNVTKVMAGDIEVDPSYYEISGNTGKEAKTYSLTVTAKTVDSSGNPIKNNFKNSKTVDWVIKNRTVTISELGVSESQPQGTYYSETEDLEVPEGVVAYIITGINGNSVTTQRVSYIPKGVAVLVEKGQSSESPNDIIPYPSNLPLKGTLEPVDVTSITGGTVYVLYNGEFVKSTSGTIPAHRCYLLVATNVASGTRSFGIDHGDGTTSLREVKGEKWADGEWYTLQGQRIAKPAKGLYILNGKKVVIK